MQYDFNNQLNDPKQRYTYFAPQDKAWKTLEVMQPSIHKKMFMQDFAYHVSHMLKLGSSWKLDCFNASMSNTFLGETNSGKTSCCWRSFHDEETRRIGPEWNSETTACQGQASYQS